MPVRSEGETVVARRGGRRWQGVGSRQCEDKLIPPIRAQKCVQRVKGAVVRCVRVGAARSR